MRISRTRGAVSGAALMLLGAWGALIPLVGPYFDWVIGKDSAWQLTAPGLWLSVVPGVVAFVGGFIVTASAHRARAGLGAWLGILAGAWFVVGEQVSRLWHDGSTWSGQALGGTAKRVFEHLTYFDALGALIVAFAALALGRLAVRSIRDAELEREAELERDREAGPVVVADTDRPKPRRTRESGRFDRETSSVGATGDVALGGATAGPTPSPPAATGDGRPLGTTPADGALSGDAPAAGDTRAERSDTLSAADRVREAANSTRGRSLFRRKR